MQIVNGAGHNPHQEQPNVINKHITKFIKGKLKNFPHLKQGQFDGIGNCVFITVNRWLNPCMIPSIVLVSDELSYMTKWSSMMKVVSQPPYKFSSQNNQRSQEWLTKSQTRSDKLLHSSSGENDQIKHWHGQQWHQHC